MKQTETAIADNLKQIREGRHLSLDQLSELTGVSKSMLRQIETGKSSPTIATIWKIANGLRLSFSALISRQSPHVAIMDFKAAKPLTAKSEKYRLFPMFPFDPEHSFEIYYFEIEPGTSYEGEPHQGNVEEYIFVMGGNLEITMEENQYAAGSNQFVRFVASRPHTYHNAGRDMVSAILMLCYLA